MPAFDLHVVLRGSRVGADVRMPGEVPVGASGSLAGRPVVLASFGELLHLPCVHVAHPFPALLGRWAEPPVVGNSAVTQGMHVRAVLFDPCAYLISSADGPVTGDKDNDVVRHVLEQPQPNEVVLNRVSGVVEHRNQDIRKHVAGGENPAFLDQQRRMARGMRRVLNNPDFGAIPRNLCGFCRQTGNETEQVQRCLLGDFRR